MNIEILTIPNNTLKETGLGSFQACENIMESLLDSNHNAIITICKNETDLFAIVKRKLNFVVAAVKYIFNNGQKIWISEYFDK